MTQREAFEKWAANAGYSDFRWSKSSEQYGNIFTHAQWEGWQARASEHAELLRKALAAMDYWMPDESMVEPKHAARWNEDVATLALLRQHIEEKR